MLLGGEEFADALFGVVEHLVHLGAGVGVVFGGGLGFDEAAIGEARFFRTPQWSSDVFCDQKVKDACKAAGMKGLRFVNCTPKRRRQGAQ